MERLGLSPADWVALGLFVVAWIGYGLLNDRTVAGQKSLNRMMNSHRYHWMRSMMARDNRIIDANINATLQNGAAFFASTSLLAIGGSLTLLRATNEVATIFADLPFGFQTTRLAWEIKTLGLVVIFVYAFFKFAWSYRLFNYGAILIGAVPNLKSDTPPEAMQAAAWRAASMNAVAGRHFNRGQRAFFFSLAYLGWFVSAYVLMVVTIGVLIVMWRRQFASDARMTLASGVWPDPP